MSSNSQVTIGVTAIDKASQILDTVDQNVKETASAVENAGNLMASSSDKAAEAMSASGTKIISKWQQMKDSARANAQQILSSTAALGVGIIGFATSFDTLNKAQTRSDQMNLTYQKSLRSLEELQASGKASSDELAEAQEQVRINSEKLALAQDAVSDTYTNFLANIPGQFMNFANSAIGITKLMGIESIASSVKAAIFGSSNVAAMAATSASAIGGAATYNGALVSMNAATLTTTGAVHAFRAATILAFITNPVGTAIIGVTTLVTLLALNVGGLRDMVFNLGDAIMHFLYDRFRPLHDAIKWFIDNVAAPLGNWFGELLPGEISVTDQAVANLQMTTNELGTQGPLAIAQFETALMGLEGTAIKSANNIQEAYERMKAGVESNVKSIFDDDFVRGRSGSSGGSNNRPSADDVKRNKGSLIDAIREKSGRSLDSGGVLYEDVYGIGMRTGTPHMLHEGETVTPRNSAVREPVVNVYITDKGKDYDVEVEVDNTRRRHLKTTRQRYIAGPMI